MGYLSHISGKKVFEITTYILYHFLNKVSKLCHMYLISSLSCDRDTTEVGLKARDTGVSEWARDGRVSNRGFLRQSYIFWWPLHTRIPGAYPGNLHLALYESLSCSENSQVKQLIKPIDY